MIVLPDPAPGRGVYRYALNGEPTGVEEYFVVEPSRTGSGSAVLSRRRAPGGVALEVTIEPRETGADCLLSFRSDRIGPVESLYQLRDGSLTVTRSGAGPTAVDADGVISPLMRVAQGPAIAACLAAGGPLDVVVPALDPADPESLLCPEVQRRSAERAGVESTAAGVVRHCRYRGGNYDDSADFWLDERDRLVRYRYPESADRVWDVTLVEG